MSKVKAFGDDDDKKGDLIFTEWPNSVVDRTSLGIHLGRRSLEDSD